MVPAVIIWLNTSSCIIWQQDIVVRTGNRVDLDKEFWIPEATSNSGLDKFSEIKFYKIIYGQSTVTKKKEK